MPLTKGFAPRPHGWLSPETPTSSHKAFTMAVPLDVLYGSTPLDIDASVPPHFFNDKVTTVHIATSVAESSSFTPAPLGCELQVFKPVSPVDVSRQVQLLPDKQCSLDPIPI